MKVLFTAFVLSAAPALALAQCAIPLSQAELNINNVRTTINASNSNWWDKKTAKYEVPKGKGVNAFFCGSVWIGGIDQSQNLHVAAQNYLQNGSDFFSGYSGANENCKYYDRIWKLNQSDVANFKNTGKSTNPDILQWPAYGNIPGPNHNLAPFKDVDGDNIYNPAKGDYPYFPIYEEAKCRDMLLGDQMLWWVFNDFAGTHTESDGEILGITVQAMAFAYDNPTPIIKNSSFYQYKIINGSTNNYSKTYIGTWVDNDIGYAFDDFVGCDVPRNLAYAYNGDNFDNAGNGSPGYGSIPPAAGILFLDTPIAELDSIDNDKDGKVDEAGEKLGMSSFVFYEGVYPRDNPKSPIEYYNYMRAIWQDGKHVVYGGDGYPRNQGTSNVKCNFMFPGDSDPKGFGTKGVAMPAWSEELRAIYPKTVGILPAAVHLV